MCLDAIAGREKTGHGWGMEPKYRLVIVCLRPKPENQDHLGMGVLMQNFKTQIKLKCPVGMMTEIQYGIFLMEKDECFPALVGLLQAMKDDDRIDLCVLGVDESPATLSPSRQDIGSWIQGMGRKVRWTHVPPKAP
jgi:hypothetical protein